MVSQTGFYTSLCFSTVPCQCFYFPVIKLQNTLAVFYAFSLSHEFLLHVEEKKEGIVLSEWE